MNDVLDAYAGSPLYGSGPPQISLPSPGLQTSDSFIDSMKVTGLFHVEVWRQIKPGKWACIAEDFFNAMTNEGLNDMLGVYFHADTQSTAWYIGLISNSSYSALAAGDTMASHAGWTESVAYSQSTRVQWSMGASSAKSITNGTPATFDMTVDNTVIKGIFVVSNSTKSGTTGKLWSTGLFSADQTLANGDQLKVTYTVNLQ